MALLKTQSFEAAETEASECVRKNRTYTKGFFRRALARRALGKLKECSDDFSTVCLAVLLPCAAFLLLLVLLLLLLVH